MVRTLQALAGDVVVASLDEATRLDVDSVALLSRHGVEVTQHPRLLATLLRSTLAGLALGPRDHASLARAFESLVWDDALDVVERVATLVRARQLVGTTLLLRVRTFTSVVQRTLSFDRHSSVVVNLDADDVATSVRTRQGMVWRDASGLCKFQFTDVAGEVVGVRLL